MPFSLPSPSSLLLLLPIVVNQKFCYHGNVTSHVPSLLDQSCYLRLYLGIETVSCRLLQRVARWVCIGPTFSSLTTMCTKIPPKKSYMMKFAVWSYLLHNSTGAKTKLNARLTLRQKVDLLEANISADKISLLQEHFCPWVKEVIDLVTVFDAILASRLTREKLQWLCENLMSNNFRRTALLKKYDL